MPTTLNLGEVRLSVKDDEGAEREVRVALAFSTWMGRLSVSLDALGAASFPAQIDVYGADGGFERYARVEIRAGGSYALYTSGASSLAVLK